MAGKLFKTVSILSFIVLMKSCPDFSPEYGVLPLKLSESQEVYLKREIRGQNYDVVVLSPNKDHCSEADPKSDYIFRGHSSIFYKIEGNTLILFLAVEATPPESGSFPIKVVQNVKNFKEFVQIRNNYQNLGLTRLEVKIDNSLKCH